MMTEHERRVERVAAEVAEFYRAKKPFRIFHGNTNSTRIMQYNRSETVDVSDFNHVLAVDTVHKTALVEPNVPMDQLVQETLKHGLVPPVVMEFPGITVGGGTQGGAGESSSWKWGTFNRICNWHEMVLADGSVVKTSPKIKPDLYHNTAGSFGSLGVIAASEIKLLPAKKYVTLTYLRVKSFEDAVATLQRVVPEGKYEYIDGIMFSKTRGVIMVGNLSNAKVGRTRRFSRAIDNWFYLHADTVSQRSHDTIESIPLVDYLFRYDRGAFWVGRYGFERGDIPFNRLTRFITNPIMHTRKLYEVLQESGASQQYFVQDMAVPEDKAAEFMHYVDRKFTTYPLWLCPLLTDTESPLLSSHLNTPLVINVGIWSSKVIRQYDEFVKINRMVEKQLQKMGGKKWFYAQSYYPEEEFWRMYNKAAYDRLRKKYKAESLPTVYDKIRTKGPKPVNIRKAAWKTIFGAAKLKIKD